MPGNPGDYRYPRRRIEDFAQPLVDRQPHTIVHAVTDDIPASESGGDMVGADGF